MTSPSRLRALLLALPFLALTACDSNDADPCDAIGDCGPPPPARVLVASQGNFSEGNGTLTEYRLADSTATDVVSGLFLQSVHLHAGMAYLASTSSVEVIGADTYVGVRTFGGVPNPRYFAEDDGVLWVTNLYTNAATYGEGGVTKLDLHTGAVVDTAVIGGNPDGIARIGGRLFVANYEYGAGRTLTLLDPETLDERQRIDVGCDGPRFLFADEQGELLVVCEGATDYGAGTRTPGQILVVDPNLRSVTARVTLPTGLGTASLGQVAAYSAAAEELYAIDDVTGTVYRYDTATNALAGQFTVTGAGLNAVGYDARDGRLYLGRPDAGAALTAPGSVTIHDRAGAEVGRFAAGVLPTHIAFAD